MYRPCSTCPPLMDYSLLFGSLQRRLFVLATVQKNSLMFANENFFVQITASALVGRKHKSFIFLDFVFFFSIDYSQPCVNTEKNIYFGFFLFVVNCVKFCIVYVSVENPTQKFMMRTPKENRTKSEIFDAKMMMKVNDVEDYCHIEIRTTKSILHQFRERRC